jgi:hypothetical protein
MKTRSTAVLGTVIMLIAPALTGCGVSTVLSGCTERDQRLVEILNKDAVLVLHPSPATQVKAYADCDSDDGFAYAGRQFQSDVDRDKIIAFYQQAAPQAGWTVTSQNPPPRPDALVVSPGIECFSKEIDGTTAHLIVGFPSDFNHPSIPDSPRYPSNLFRIELRGSHDGNLWC